MNVFGRDASTALLSSLLTHLFHTSTALFIGLGGCFGLGFNVHEWMGSEEGSVDVDIYRIFFTRDIPPQQIRKSR